MTLRSNDLGRPLSFDGLTIVKTIEKIIFELKERKKNMTVYSRAINKRTVNDQLNTRGF